MGDTAPSGSLLHALDNVAARVRELEGALVQTTSAAEREAARRSEVERELAQRNAHDADVHAQLDEARREADSLRSRLESAEGRARQAVDAERVERERLRVQAEGLRAEVARLKKALEEERAAGQGRVDAVATLRAHLAEGRQQWSRIEALLDELEGPDRTADEATRVANPRVAPAPAPPPPAPPGSASPADDAVPAPAAGVDIEHLARSDLGRAERVSARSALERLPSRLEEGEGPKRLAIAEYADAATLMAVTDRRILLLKLDEQAYLGIPYERITSVGIADERFGRSSLRITSHEGEVVVSKRRRDAVEELSRLVRERAGVR